MICYHQNVLKRSLGLTKTYFSIFLKCVMDLAFRTMCSHSMTKLAFYLFDENLIFRKRLGVATYFCFIFKGEKIRKKTLSMTPYLEKQVCEKPSHVQRSGYLLGRYNKKTKSTLLSP